MFGRHDRECDARPTAVTIRVSSGRGVIGAAGGGRAARRCEERRRRTWGGRNHDSTANESGRSAAMRGRGGAPEAAAAVASNTGVRLPIRMPVDVDEHPRRPRPASRLRSCRHFRAMECSITCTYRTVKSRSRRCSLFPPMPTRSRFDYGQQHRLRRDFRRLRRKRPNGIWGTRYLSSSQVAKWTTTADIAGPGITFGPDATVYVATTGGEMVALDPKTLDLKTTYKAPVQAFSSAPLVFQFNNKPPAVAAPPDAPDAKVVIAAAA